MRYFVLLLVVFGITLKVSAQYWFASYAHHGRDISASAVLRPYNLQVGGGVEVAEQFEDFLLSFDGGILWNVWGTDTPTSRVMCMAFKDSLNGCGVCYMGKMVRTTDGGNVWNKVQTFSNRNFFKVIYVTPQVLFIAGGSQTLDTSSIYKSNDGGISWINVYDQPGQRLKSICFLDTLNGFAVGESSIILKTTNGGLTWLPVSPPVTDRSFNDIVFRNNTDGFIIGGVRDSIRTLLSTSNAGQNWIVAKDEDGGAYNDITFIDSLEGFIVGDSATVLRTTDGGQNWMTDPVPNIAADQRINTIAFRDSKLGVMGGNNGFVQVYAIASTPVAITLPHAPIDTNNVMLLGKINTFGIPSQVYFLVSTDSTLPFASTATWGGIFSSDSLTYYTQPVYNLDPDSTYYYSLRVVGVHGIVNGDTLSFKPAIPGYTFQTLWPSSITPYSVQLNGMVSNFPDTVELSFDFGTTAAMPFSLPATPSTISDTSQSYVTAQVLSLQPSTNYYFRLRGEANGVVYLGVTYVFSTDSLPPHVSTLPAFGVSTSTAIINGLVRSGSYLPDTITFEYGLSNSFGNEVTATPHVINDTLQHYVTASLNNLTPNSVYYYRVISRNSIGQKSTGDTKLFYTSASTIPNWDFEDWTHVVEANPRGWYYYGNAVSVPSYNSTQALHLFGDSKFAGGVAFTGMLFPGMPSMWGSPFTARPDSLIFFANHNIAVDDTAFELLSIKQNGIEIGTAPFLIEGNTNGSFVRYAVPISYTALGNPDTVIIAFASSVRLFNNWTPSTNWLQVDDISFSQTAQTVVNADFEVWDTTEYDTPDSWFSSRDNPKGLLDTIPVTKTTDAYSGQYAVRMESLLFPYGSFTGFVINSQAEGGYHPGFPVDRKWESLTGYFKYQPVNNDTMNLTVVMFKAGQQIGFGGLTIDTAVSDYTPFSVPIWYNQPNEMPDSAMIFLQNCNWNPHGNSVLYVDALSMSGFDPAFTNVPVVPSIMAAGLTIYPNPAGNYLNIKAEGMEQSYQIEVFDITGSMKYSIRQTTNHHQIDLSDFSTGIYFVKVGDGQKSMNGKFIIAR